MNAIKNNCFEYILYKIECYHNENGNGRSLALSRLKAMKLLFFIAAVKYDGKNDLLDIFNNFYAMQYGPVESDIYNAVANNELTFYDLTGQEIKEKGLTFDFTNIKNIDAHRIDTAIKKLLSFNQDIFYYGAFRLVDLSHLWKSWERAYEIANLLGKGSEYMKIKAIKEDVQYFNY